MIYVDLLSDTTYRKQAVEQLGHRLGNSSKFPVESTQIYGLRQIARQEPGEVKKFASHQGQRAQSRYDEENKKSSPKDDVLQFLQAEIDFWTLVANLCSDSAPDWSVHTEGSRYLPEELGDQNLRKIPGPTPQETQKNQQHNNKLRRDKRKWYEQWANEHIPAFFERFCTHCLYCIAKAEMGQLGGEDTNEAVQQTQQEQSENLGGEAMHTAFQQANLVE